MSPAAAKSIVNRERVKIRPPVPRSIEALGLMAENYLPCRNYYRCTVSALGPPGGLERVDAAKFANQSMSERLGSATEIHIDGTFKVKINVKTARFN